jgi:hypothetical protein
VQGMSDLLSPILYVMEDESEAFWCFAALMERMAPNFHRDQNGMHSQLLAISKLVQLLDNPLHDYFKQNECLNYFFCFRWILIHFKRCVGNICASCFLHSLFVAVKYAEMEEEYLR